LYIENTKYKDKFVENKIPKSILDLLQQIWKKSIWIIWENNDSQGSGENE
jgi:hypothetical protein